MTTELLDATNGDAADEVKEAARDLVLSGDPDVRSEAGRELNSRRTRSVGTCQAPDCSNPIYGYASKKYCSERCNQRAWRARRRASGFVFGHAGRVVEQRIDDPLTGISIVRKPDGHTEMG